jgi:hypothetical protein
MINLQIIIYLRKENKQRKMSTEKLTCESITFGKYKGSTLSTVLRDRKYCAWLVEQDWLKENYEYIYNRIREYNPKTFFINLEKEDNGDFIDSYVYFNLTPLENLTVDLNSSDRICYEYYLRMIDEIRSKIYERLENEEENPYDIKAPTSWLKRFEKECGMPRTEFKEFIDANELPNIPYIIERIKKEGGLEYKGAQSYRIAKSRSETQEKWWENILKTKYGENVSTQFKYENCIFDMIVIKTNTIFECKLGLKDFDESQHRKYKTVLNRYRIIYLISKDCVVHIEKKVLYTSNPDKYKLYLTKIPFMKEPTYLDLIITDFTIVEVNDMSTLFGKEE